MYTYINSSKENVYLWSERLRKKSKGRATRGSVSGLLFALVVFVTILLPAVTSNGTIIQEECPSKTIMEIESRFVIGSFSLNDVLRSEKDFHIALKADQGKMAAKFKNFTTGKGMDVPVHCQNLEWTLSRVAVDLDCPAFDQVRFDSSQAPRMLIFDQGAASNCENGLYDFMIRAREKRTGSEADVQISFEVVNGPISMSSHQIAKSGGQEPFGNFLSQINRKNKEGKESIRKTARKLVYAYDCDSLEKQYMIQHTDPDIKAQEIFIGSQDGPTYIKFNLDGSPIALSYIDRDTEEPVTVDPSCLQLQWKVANGPDNLEYPIQFDNDANPSMIIIPEQPEGVISSWWSKSVLLKLWNSNQGADNTVMFLFYVNGNPTDNSISEYLTSPTDVCSQNQTPSQGSQIDISIDVSQNSQIQIDPFMTEGLACFNNIACSQLDPDPTTYPDLCSSTYSAYDSSTKKWEFNSFDVSTLTPGIVDYPVTFSLTMTVSQGSQADQTNTDFSHVVTLTDSSAAQCQPSQSSDLLNHYGIIPAETDSLLMHPFKAACGITNISCTQANPSPVIDSIYVPDLCSSTFGSYDSFKKEWVFKSFDPSTLGMEYPANFHLIMTVTSIGDIVTQFSHNIELHNIECSPIQSSQVFVSHDISLVTNLVVEPFRAVEQQQVCEIFDIACRQIYSSQGLNLCDQYSSRHDGTFDEFDPSLLEITSYPITFELEMRVNSWSQPHFSWSDHSQFENDFTHTVTLTESMPPVECSPSQISPASVSHDITSETSLMIDPFEAIGNNCQIISIQCTQANPDPADGLDLCSPGYGAFSSESQLWEFYSFDPSTLGIVEQTVKFELSMRVELAAYPSYGLSQSQYFDFQYEVSLIHSSDCSDPSLNSIMSPEDQVIDYTLGTELLNISYPKFTVAQPNCGGVQDTTLLSYDPLIISQNNDNGDLWIETNRQSLNGSQTKLVFETSLVSDPSVTAKAYIYINMKSSVISTYLNKMPDPYFQKIGSKISKPFVFDLDDQIGAKEYDLGEILVLNRFGSTKVTVQSDSSAETFLQVQETKSSYQIALVNEEFAMPGFYTINFVISSSDDADEQQIKVPVNVLKTGQKTEKVQECTSCGVISYEVPDRENTTQKLKIENMQIKSVGQLKLQFNNNIEKLSFETSQQDDQSKRNLKQVQYENFGTIRFKDVENEEEYVLRLKVQDEDDFDEDKSIISVTYSQKDETENEGHSKEITIDVMFNDTQAITSDIREPDVLVLEMLQKDSSIDAQSSQTFSQYFLDLVPQMSSEEYEELQQMVETAAKIGFACSIWQIILCLILNKAINSMWIFINSAQFLVFIGMWQITFSRRMQVLFTQLKRIFLGEYIDDLQIGQNISVQFGIEVSSDADETQEKLGYDRLGSGDIMANIGITFIFGIFVLILIVMIVAIVTIISRTCELSEKNKERKKKLKTKIFFNPLIRMAFLGSLKFNMSSLIVFKKEESSTAQLILASILFIVIALLIPIILVKVLYANEEDLHEKNKFDKYGTMYVGRRVNNSQDKKRRVWIYPATFFIRRTVFIVASVFLFEYPQLQIVVHQLLTMATLIYISYDGRMFDNKPQKWVEICSELLQFLVSIFIQQQQLYYNEEDMVKLIEISVFTSLGLLVILNTSFFIYNIVIKRQEKNRLKAIEESKKEYQIAEEALKVKQEEKQKRVEQNKLLLLQKIKVETISENQEEENESESERSIQDKKQPPVVSTKSPRSSSQLLISQEEQPMTNDEMKNGPNLIEIKAKNPKKYILTDADFQEAQRIVEEEMKAEGTYTKERAKAQQEQTGQLIGEMNQMLQDFQMQQKKQFGKDK